MERKRVVITGLGLLTPVGNNREETWKALISGRSGIGKIGDFDAQDYPSQIAGEIKNFAPSFLDRKS